MLCKCGCNQPAGVYKYNDSRTGVKKGQPRRFLPGHTSYIRRLTDDEVKTREQPPQLCACQCKRPSGFYQKTDRDNGQIKGAPRRFLPGHSSYAPRVPKHSKVVTKVDWGSFVPPGSQANCDGVPEGCPLSNLEYEVMTLAAKGYTNKELASTLNVAVSTIRSHLSRSFTALGLKNRKKSAAIILMKDLGWLGSLPRELQPARPQPIIVDSPLTLQQLVYVAAFTRLVLERTSHCENMVTVAYMLMCMHMGWKPSRARNPPDIDELLLRIGRGVMRDIPLD